MTAAVFQERADHADGICPECQTRPISAYGLCNACYKRLIWRPAGGPAVDNDRAASRAYKNTHREQLREHAHVYLRARRGRCQDCGGLMGIGYAADGICMACRKRARHERALLIVDLWAQGIALREIVSRLGFGSVSRLGAEMTWLRKQGYDLPHRRPRRAAVLAAASTTTGRPAA